LNPEQGSRKKKLQTPNKLCSHLSQQPAEHEEDVICQSFDFHFSLSTQRLPEIIPETMAVV
jgi:hypothetical protein